MSTTSKANAPRRPGRVAKGCLTLFGLPFLAGGLFVAWSFAGMVFNSLRARSWVGHPCAIVSAKREFSSGGRGGRSMRPVVEYTWDWNGKQYQSDVVSFLSGSGNVGSFQESVARETSAAVGKPNGFRCRVNPDNPSEAVLYRDVRWGIALFFLPFIALFPPIGASMLFSPLLDRARSRRDAAAKREHPDAPHLWRDDWTRGWVEDRGIWHTTGERLSLLWFTLSVSVVFGSLFLTDDWSGGRIVVAILMGAALVLLLRWMARSIACSRRFGRLRFIPDSLLLTPGHPMSGMVQLRRPLRFPHRVNGRVEVGRKGGTSKSMATSEADVEVVQSGVLIRVNLPEAPPSGPPGDHYAVEWSLRINAPGDVLSATFDLPVFGQQNKSA